MCEGETIYISGHSHTTRTHWVVGPLLVKQDRQYSVHYFRCVKLKSHEITNILLKKCGFVTENPHFSLCYDSQQCFKLGITHEKQWIRAYESTSAKREWIRGTNSLFRVSYPT